MAANLCRKLISYDGLNAWIDKLLLCFISVMTGFFFLNVFDFVSFIYVILF